MGKCTSKWAYNCGSINESNCIIKVNSVSNSNGSSQCNVSKSISNCKSNGASKSNSKCKSNRVMKSNSQSISYVISNCNGKCKSMGICKSNAKSKSNTKSNFAALTCLLLIGAILNSKLLLSLAFPLPSGLNFAFFHCFCHHFHSFVLSSFMVLPNSKLLSCLNYVPVFPFFSRYSSVCPFT